MTKVPQYAAVLRVPLRKVTTKGQWGMHAEGAARAGTLQADPIGLDIEVELDSDAPAEDLARVVRTAECACYSTQAMQQEVPTRLKVKVDGAYMAESVLWPEK
jgi:hypothetical protein